jgi:hypothetical protein
MPLYAYEEDIYDDLGQEYDDGIEEYDELGEDDELVVLLEEEEDEFGARRRKGKRRKGRRTKRQRIPKSHIIVYKKLKRVFEAKTGLHAKMIPKGPGARKAQLKYYLAFLGWAKKNKGKLIAKMGPKGFKVATNVLRNQVQKSKVRYAASK